MKQWIIAICTSMVYLGISFVLNAWAYSWMIWAVYCVYRMIGRKILKSYTICQPSFTRSFVRSVTDEVSQNLSVRIKMCLL